MTAADETAAAAAQQLGRTTPQDGAEESPVAGEADVMLLGLKAEEPEALKGAWIVPMVAGGPILVMGLAMAVMGAMAMAGSKQNPTQGLVSGVLIAGAVALLALGGWLVAKSLKTRSIGG
jgi:hypothetical protein